MIDNKSSQGRTSAKGATTEVATTAVAATRKRSNEQSEKIQVQVESTSFSLRFPNKTTLEKIIEYINFESSNKYTLVLNYSTASKQQQPTGRLASKSPSARKSTLGRSSTSDMGAAGAVSRKSSERKKSQTKQSPLNAASAVDVVTDNNAAAAGGVIAGGSTNEILDQVLTKVRFISTCSDRC